MSEEEAAQSGEDRLIARYFKPLAKHPGAFALADDAAAIAPPPGCDLVLKTDGIVGGVHFFPDDPPDAVGKKALRVNLSDLAAKGAEPLGFLLTLALPADIGEAWLAPFARGLGADADLFGCPLFGGDTVRTGGPVTCSASATSTGVGPIFAGNIVDVEVDPETGKVAILRCTAFIDAGQAVHPSFVEGQMQGGTVQGIGWALHEEYAYTADGVMTNPTLLDYRMPTTVDVPMIDTVIVEVPNPRHPFGLRGVGEVPIIPPLAAIANAIYNAIGVRMTRLPMSPGAILEALQAKETAT